jgi:antitoxin component YwqK of YwqJK toxin-antitoxin module
MLKWISILGCFLCFSLAQGQTFQVFKGDTINRRDKEGKKQGIWRKYYSNDTLCSESTFKYGRHTGEFKTWTRKENCNHDLCTEG